MSETGPEMEPPKLEEIDLDDLNPWLNTYIKEPFEGTDDARNPDGTVMTHYQKVEHSRDQLRRTAEDRDAYLEGMNQLKISKGKEPISKEQNDEMIKRRFIKIAQQQPQKE